MTTDHIIEANKTIAEFIGGVNTGNKDWRTGQDLWRIPTKNLSLIDVPLCDMLFYGDWNWLMWIVEEIEKRGYSMTMDQHEKVHRAYFNRDETLEEVANGYTDLSRIDCVFFAVVDLINHLKSHE